MIYVGWQLQRGIPYYLSLAAALGLVIYQYALIRERNPANCFKAFLHNNWVGATVFAGIALDSLLTGSF
jgi:4-hydroxybenzoate polyprenyltransferase